jgi:hypothetical protein
MSQVLAEGSKNNKHGTICIGPRAYISSSSTRQDKTIYNLWIAATMGCNVQVEEDRQDRARASVLDSVRCVRGICVGKIRCTTQSQT